MVKTGAGSFPLLITDTAKQKATQPHAFQLQACLRLSKSSDRETSFYELDLQVKGFVTLEDSLVRARPLCVAVLGFRF